MFSNLDFSEGARALDSFWISKGCVKLNSSSNKLGAATFHPEMLKNIITSKHCKFCCLQPTFRPYDGDYGLSYSLQQHFQYQVIIKPFYGLAGKLCLESLKGLGYSASLHKLVFKQSNWESSSLCAWGTGWECVINSLEVAQITLFRQICGLKCDLPVLEISYGLERLVCSLSSSRISLSECELGFNYYNLNCVCVTSSFQMFRVLEQNMRYLARFEFFGSFYPVYDLFLSLVFIYNQLVSKISLKRKMLRILLLRLQRLVHTFARVLARARSTDENINLAWINECKENDKLV
ncbi:Glycine--tRNA ligase alpha subunit [Candidatus Hodgkinia cicadicola]|nr:Glycine--tRNA ligase alpha subunit [Candidatus Hodgkinia cicadicola]